MVTGDYEPCGFCGGTKQVVDSTPGYVSWICLDCYERTIEEVVEP